MADLTLDKTILKEIAEGNLGPAGKREAVGHVRRRLEVCERRACRVTGQSGSTQRPPLKRDHKDKALHKEILKLSGEEKQVGYRSI